MKTRDRRGKGVRKGNLELAAKKSAFLAVFLPLLCILCLFVAISHRKIRAEGPLQAGQFGAKNDEHPCPHRTIRAGSCAQNPKKIKKF